MLCRRILHFETKILKHLHSLPAQEGSGRRHPLTVFLWGNLSNTRSRAVGNNVVATMFIGIGIRHAGSATAQPEPPFKKFNRHLGRHARRVGTKIDCAVILSDPAFCKGGKRVLHIDADHHEALVVLPQRIVVRTELLDQLALSQDRLRLGLEHNNVKIGDRANQAPDLRLGRTFRVAPEIALNPLAQRGGLSDIDNLPIPITHQIAPWLIRQIL